MALGQKARIGRKAPLPTKTATCVSINAASANAILDADHTVGELRFDTPAPATINSPGNFTLTANTGVTTTAAATGSYVINANYQINAFNIFDVEAGTVTVNGGISGAYGMEKDGAGMLALTNNNTFTGSLTVGGGTLRLTGSNAYTGSTTVLQGSLIVGTDGALGGANSNIAVGADSATFSLPAGVSAALILDGGRTLDRNIALANGSYEKRLGATNASAGATFSGTVDFGTADNIKLTAAAATDRLVFSGTITGGATAGGVTLDGAGTVVFSGQAKVYASATSINGGVLQIANGTSFTGAGTMSVTNGATLRVDGTLGGGGALAINAGVLTGSGAVNRAFSLGAGATLSPGNGVGMLSTVSEIWTGGGTYRWEVNAAASNYGGNPGQDLVNITGSLSLNATAANRFTLQLRTLTAAGAAGLLDGFNPDSNYTVSQD
jgi:fibronectin-binding autotransporter adhesin